MPIILLIIIVLLVAGGGGWYHSGWNGSGISLGTVLLVLLVLWLIGVLR